MLTLLGLGFLLGLRHAFEPDHAAAIAALASRSTSVRDTVRQGVAWGIGHSLTLLVFCSAVYSLEAVVPEQVAQGLEAAVGVMLIGLGLDVWRKMRRERFHYHLHEHDKGPAHIHLHAHRTELRHTLAVHQHPHGIPYRALLVGFMHGMAGSAALILLTLHTMVSIVDGLTYIVLFGIGSIVGMATLSVVIAVPLRRSAHYMKWAYDGLQVVIAGISIMVGANMIYVEGTSFLR
jgi:ABC-type nickel/cobalt efflux system permease component RcnA